MGETMVMSYPALSCDLLRSPEARCECSVCKGILRLHHPVDVAHLYLSYICAFMDWLLCFSCVVSPKVTSKGHMMWWSKVLQWFDP